MLIHTPILYFEQKVMSLPTPLRVGKAIGHFTGSVPIQLNGATNTSTPVLHLTKDSSQSISIS